MGVFSKRAQIPQNAEFALTDAYKLLRGVQTHAGVSDKKLSETREDTTQHKEVKCHDDTQPTTAGPNLTIC